MRIYVFVRRCKMIPYDVIKHILAFCQYEDIPTWASVNTQMYRHVFPRLQCIRYPQDVDSLNALCKATKKVILDTEYDGNAQHVQIIGNGNRLTGKFRHCYIENCCLTEAVLIHSDVKGGEIRAGEVWFNVETNGTCELHDVIIKYNSKGLINMGYLTMRGCKIEYNNTGVETRGELTLINCTIKHNSVGVHATGSLIMQENDMQNNSINFLRTQPNRPLQRCWTQ